MHIGQMEVLVFGLLVLAPATGARHPRQILFPLPAVLLNNMTVQDESIFVGSGNSESLDPTVNDISFQAPKPGSGLSSINVAFEDSSLDVTGSNIPSAPALGLPPGIPLCADEVLHVDGNCVTPIIRRNIFTFAEPPTTTVPPVIPPPVITYDIVFIKSPESTNTEPIIIPPPQQKTLVYLLSKKSPTGPNIIEVPTGPQSQPEVYYVNYNGATGRVDLGRPISDIILPTGDHLSNVLSTNFLQSARSTAVTQTPVQESLSTSSINTINNQNVLNTNFLQSVGPTAATQNTAQGALPISSDIIINNQNNLKPINNSNLPTFELIDNSSINNIGLPKFQMVQNFGTASNDEILRRFGIDMSNINLLRRSLKF